MLPFGVTIPATVPQGSEIPEGLMNNPVFNLMFVFWPYNITGLHTIPDQLLGPSSLLLSGNSGSEAVGM
jgi:hypothetical protein